MSGFVALIQLDGGAVDREILEGLTATLRFRGPDAERVWTSGNAGLGHAMFRTTYEAEREVQPCSLDGSAWISGDIRVDARVELRRKLEAKGRTGLTEATDPELILHAYAAWGDDCVDHLLGDFSFAIWDATRQRLFCARDHFGVKGLYYAKVGRSLVLSNSLHCVRAHPEVSDQLNDLAVCDFLLCGYNQESSTTIFAGIQCVSPGHTMVWSKLEAGGEFRIRRYWTLPIDEPIRYKRSQEYVDHFRDLLHAAVDDRLRTNKVGVYMSGGLDSPLLAATAKQILANRAGDYDLRAYTGVYDHLIPDDERHYAGLVARHLQIPIHFKVLDGYQPYERWDTGELHPPEPVHNPFSAQSYDWSRETASNSRVVLNGQGPDVLLMYERRRYISFLLNRGQYWRAGVDLLKSFWVQPGIPMSFLHKNDRGPQPPQFPAWIRPDMASRYRLQERWERWYTRVVEADHPVRPAGYTGMQQPVWRGIFESLDADRAGIPTEERLPFLDLRVARFLLAVPAIPWGRSKFLLREALKGPVPEEVRQRRKSPMAEDVFAAALRGGRQSLERGTPHPEVFRYISAMPDLNLSSDDNIWIDTAPLSLSLWMDQRRSNVSMNFDRQLTERPYRRKYVDTREEREEELRKS